MSPELVAFALSPWWGACLAGLMALAAWPLSLVTLDLVRGEA